MSSAEDVQLEAHQWRAMRQDGELSGRDEARFRQWLAEDPAHSVAYMDAEIAWEALGKISYEASGVAMPPALVEDSGSTFGTGPVASSWASAKLVVASLAACALVFLVLTGSIHESIETESEAELAPVGAYHTARGEIRTWEMPDGTVMTLAPKSTADFRFSESRREVWLRAGAAYLKVSKNEKAPFTVDAGPARIAVTGTAFDLQLRQDRLSVSVSEGVVRVSQVNQPPFAVGQQYDQEQPQSFIQDVSLRARENVVVSSQSGISQVRTLDVDHLGAWRSGRLVYVDAELGDVVADLNQFGASSVTIDDPSRSLRLSGTFSIDDTDDILEVIELALPVTVSLGQAGHRIELIR